MTVLFLNAISFLSLASAAFALRFKIPDHTHIIYGYNTTVTLIHDEEDPTDVVLKKNRLKHNNTSKEAIHIINFTTDTAVNITFHHSDTYQIFAYTNASINDTFSTPLAWSSEIKVQDRPFVFETQDDHDDKGSHHGSDKGLIVGAVLGSVALTVIVLLAVYLIFFHSRPRRCLQDRLVRQSDTPASSFVQYLYPKYPSGQKLGSTNLGGSPPPGYVSSSPASYHATFNRTMTTKSISSSMTSLSQKPLTDRQMDILGRLHSLQEKLLKLEGASWRGQDDFEAAENDAEVLDTKAKIGTLKDFMECPWSLNATSDVPAELVYCFTSY